MSDRSIITSVDVRQGIITVSDYWVGSIVGGDYIFRTGDFSSDVMRFDVGFKLTSEELDANGDTQLNPAAVAALTVLCGLEFMRRRRAEVAASEDGGASLVSEFLAWMASLLSALKAAVQATDASPEGAERTRANSSDRDASVPTDVCQERQIWHQRKKNLEAGK